MAARSKAASDTRRPLLRGDFGMVGSTHWIASAVAMGILEQGGNAFDAAVAAGLALNVLEPHNNSIGGECVIVVHDKGRGETDVICGQGVVPSRATADEFLQRGQDRVPGNGPSAACVPGMLDAWLTLARDYGTLGLRPLFEPAISLAQQGVPVIARMGRLIRDMEETFRARWPSSAAAYLASGVPRAGDRYRNPQLAHTLQRLLDAGLAGGGTREAQLDRVRDAFYRGFVADEVENFAATETTDVAGEPSPCLVRADDLDAHRTRIERPATVEYGGMLVAKPGPWSQGPVFLQQLTLLSALGFSECDPQDPHYVHTLVEVAKLAYADREAWYGDPDVVDVPLSTLLSAGYAAERARLITDTAARDVPPGAPDGRTPVLPATLGAAASLSAQEEAAIGEPAVPDLPHARDTCYLAIADRHGNMVSAMPSGGWFHSSPAIGELGFSLGTRAQMTWLQPGLASSLTPNVRPRSTLSPTLVLDDRGPLLALGSPGGDRQDQWSLHLFLAWLHSAHNLQEAIEAPNFHTNHFAPSFYPRLAAPMEVQIEDRLDDAAAQALRDRGHHVQLKRPWSLGRMAAVGVDRKSGWLIGAADPRFHHCYAAGR